MNRLRKYTGLGSCASGVSARRAVRRNPRNKPSYLRVVGWEAATVDARLNHWYIAMHRGEPVRRQSGRTATRLERLLCDRVPLPNLRRERKTGMKRCYAAAMIAPVPQSSMLCSSDDCGTGAGRRGVGEGAGCFGGGQGPRAAISGVDEEGRARRDERFVRRAMELQGRAGPLVGGGSDGAPGRGRHASRHDTGTGDEDTRGASTGRRGNQEDR